jgi:hypothetical protein
MVLEGTSAKLASVSRADLHRCAKIRFDHIIMTGVWKRYIETGKR